MNQIPARESSPADARRNEADLDLLHRVGAGDRGAFRELYERYYYPLLRFIYRLTGQHELAQEGVNDVMLVVWRKCGSFDGRSKVSTWIMGIAYRKGLKLAERASRWHARFPTYDLSDWGEPSGAAEERIAREEMQDALEQAIGQLPPKHRVVLELTYRCGYSYEEIASICDCPVNTVKTRMFYARAKLKVLLPGPTRSGSLDSDGS